MVAESWESALQFTVNIDYSGTFLKFIEKYEIRVDDHSTAPWQISRNPACTSFNQFNYTVSSDKASISMKIGRLYTCCFENPETYQ